LENLIEEAGSARPHHLKDFQLSRNQVNVMDNFNKFKATKISRSEAASFLGITKGRLSFLENSGELHPGSDGNFSLAELFEQWTKHLKDRPSSARLEDDARIRALKIEQAERTAAKEKGELVGREWIMNNYLSLIGQLAVRLRSIPSRYTRIQNDRVKLQDMIDADFRWFQKAFADPDIAA
jgi:hypothetical protein